MRVLLGLLFLLLFTRETSAEVSILPESRHEQYRTYGLFIDQQSALLFKSSGKAWGSIGGAITLLEFPDLKYKPQLTVHGSANAAFTINGAGDTLLTETIDARAGLSADLEFTPDWRGSVMWTHQSGHISDNVPDRDLIGSNLGNEVIALRLIHDIERRFRLGGSLRAVVSADPGMIVLGGEQFLEWFPEQYPDSSHQFTPFFAFGTEEYGRQNMEFSWNAQVGLSAGNHFFPKKVSALRVVLGYYHGVDPRLKYYEFKNARSSFAYSGLMFEI